MTRIALLIAVLFCGTALVGSAQTFCCDPDAVDFSNDPFSCGQEDGGFLANDGQVCDADCSGYSSGNAACIPLDGGLSLLALAGGGLATAAMRRRREEEAQQADKA